MYMCIYIYIFIYTYINNNNDNSLGAAPLRGEEQRCGAYNMRFAVTPSVLTPFVPFRTLSANLGCKGRRRRAPRRGFGRPPRAAGA